MRVENFSREGKVNAHASTVKSNKPLCALARSAGLFNRLIYGNPNSRFSEGFVPADNGMESDDDNALAAQVAAATKAQIAADRERLRRLWTGLSLTESVIRRGQLAYLESTELLAGGNGGAATG